PVDYLCITYSTLLLSWVAVPDKAPPNGLVPMASVTLPVNPVAVLLLASSAVTCTAGVIAAPADVVLGSTEKTSCVAVPAVMLNADRKRIRLNSSDVAI